MIVPACQRYLQAVVIRFVNIPHLVDKREERKGRVERTAGLPVSSGVERGDVLVDIADAGELGAMVTDIRCFQSHFRIEGVLHVQIPGIDVRSLEILRDTHNGARTAGRDAAINGAGWEDGASA